VHKHLPGTPVVAKNRRVQHELARHDVPDLLARLDAFTPREEDEYMHERRIREALARQAWPQVQAWLEARHQDGVSDVTIRNNLAQFRGLLKFLDGSILFLQLFFLLHY